MIFVNKRRAIDRNRRAIILALLVIGTTVPMIAPLSGPVFRSRAAGATRFAGDQIQEEAAATNRTPRASLRRNGSANCQFASWFRRSS
jgi:hypothetical protein